MFDGSGTMTKHLFSKEPPASLSAPSEPAVARLICLLSTEIGVSKRVGVIAQLGDRLVEGPLAGRRPILEGLCAFVRARAPLAGRRSLRSAPSKDVQAALNVLAARPREQGPKGEETPLDLRDTDLSGAWLASAHFRLARFDGASLRMVDLSYADLEGASFRDADLGGATLAHSRLAGADFCGASLHDLELTGATLPESGASKVRHAMAS